MRGPVTIGSSVKILRFDALVASRSLLEGILKIRRRDFPSCPGETGARKIVTEGKGSADERVSLVGLVSKLKSGSWVVACKARGRRERRGDMMAGQKWKMKFVIDEQKGRWFRRQALGFFLFSIAIAFGCRKPAGAMENRPRRRCRSGMKKSQTARARIR